MKTIPTAPASAAQAMKNALEIKRRSPTTRVVIFYRDLRSYGFRERLYREARRAGVVFLKFDADSRRQSAPHPETTADCGSRLS
jgi:heterodisulfide reductase subunit A-like polyferredoxin